MGHADYRGTTTWFAVLELQSKPSAINSMKADGDNANLSGMAGDFAEVTSHLATGYCLAETLTSSRLDIFRPDTFRPVYDHRLACFLTRLDPTDVGKFVN